MTTAEEPLQTVSRLGTAPVPKTPNCSLKLSKPAVVDSTQRAGKTPRTAGHCGPSRKLNPYDSLSTLPQNNITSSALSCVDEMNLLSLKSPAKTRSGPQNMQMAMKVKLDESSKSKLILCALFMKIFLKDSTLLGTISSS